MPIIALYYITFSAGVYLTTARKCTERANRMIPACRGLTKLPKKITSTKTFLLRIDKILLNPYTVALILTSNSLTETCAKLCMHEYSLWCNCTYIRSRESCHRNRMLKKVVYFNLDSEIINREIWKVHKISEITN